MALLAAYSFDEESGTLVLDRTGNGHDFDLAGSAGVHTTDGHTLGGMTKTAAGNMPIVAEPPFGETAARTIAVWLKGNGTTWWVRWQVDSLNSGSWGLLLLTPDVAVQARDASTFVRAAAPFPTDGLWHHYAGTYDGATVRLYIDGALVASTTFAGPLRADADRIDLAEWGEGANTVLDDLRIYDEALNETAIADAMNTPVTDTTASSGALHFDGTSWQPSPTVQRWDGQQWTETPPIGVLP